MGPLLPWILLCLGSLGLLLVAEVRAWTIGKWVFKTLASTGFVGVGLVSGLTASGAGIAALVALLLCMTGDLLLIPQSRKTFLAGLIAFLLGHVAYVVAFFLQGTDPATAGTVGLITVVAAMPVLRWLWPHLPERFQAPVLAYIVVISVMLSFAAGVVAAGGSKLILLGAFTFYLSDLFVARRRFVSPGAINRIIGLPLYYVGQLLLAACITG